MRYEGAVLVLLGSILGILAILAFLIGRALGEYADEFFRWL